MLISQNLAHSQHLSSRLHGILESNSSVQDLPDVLIEEDDAFVAVLCSIARTAATHDHALNAVVQHASNMVGFGAVLSALTVFANLCDI